MPEERKMNDGIYPEWEDWREEWEEEGNKK